MIVERRSVSEMRHGHLAGGMFARHETELESRPEGTGLGTRGRVTRAVVFEVELYSTTLSDERDATPNVKAVKRETRTADASASLEPMLAGMRPPGAVTWAGGGGRRIHRKD